MRTCTWYSLQPASGQAEKGGNDMNEIIIEAYIYGLEALYRKQQKALEEANRTIEIASKRDEEKRNSGIDMEQNLNKRSLT